MSNKEELLKRVSACFERHADNTFNDSMWLPVDVQERVAALCAEVERETRAADLAAIEGERVSETGEEGDRAYNQALRDAALAIRALKAESSSANNKGMVK
jgi:hypothetical protein